MKTAVADHQPEPGVTDRGKPPNRTPPKTNSVAEKSAQLSQESENAKQHKG